MRPQRSCLLCVFCESAEFVVFRAPTWHTYIPRPQVELDFRNEVANADRLRELLASRRKRYLAAVPELYNQLCTERVIVMEWVQVGEGSGIGRRKGVRGSVRGGSGTAVPRADAQGAVQNGLGSNCSAFEAFTEFEAIDQPS
eukprot:213175-Chlamydomonas_euryale.AAC.2